MERNYFGGLGDELCYHIEDAPKAIVSLPSSAVRVILHSYQQIFRCVKKENSTIISTIPMKVPILVTTTVDETLEVQGAAFHRYHVHNFKMTMLTCNRTVSNFKGDLINGISSLCS